jgi:hypothetical protein
VMSRSTPPFRALYRVNQKECEEHKNHTHDLMENFILGRVSHLMKR